VRCSPGDNLAIHVAVTRAPAGSILVADMGGEREFGYWGEVLTTGAEARGIAGLVIDACVRDCDALRDHGFPVFSTGLALTGASKTQPGSVDRAVTVGDVAVEPGDWIVADVDGVVVLPGADLDAVFAAGAARTAKEAALFDVLRAGGTTVEEFGLDASLVEGA
jgi:4-hydroxy-4-methyl-2-oxoglutarate aldolase